jgi:uncharacterized protein (DUF58 family)
MLTQRHDVVAAVISDPRELELPAIGVVRMEDIESGRQSWVDTQSRRFRERYRVAAAGRQHSIERRIISAGAHPLPLSTGSDWVGDIVAWVMNKRRMRASSGRTA